MADTTNPKDLLGVKKTPLRLVPPALSIYVAGVMASGKSKYGELYDVSGYDGYNWRNKKVRKSVYLEAIMRHLLASLDGQAIDPESGFPHEAHIGADVSILLDAMACGSLIDDLPPKGTAADTMDLVQKILAAHADEMASNETKQRARAVIPKEGEQV